MRLKITQIRSTIKRKEDQKRTIVALGLGKINRVKIHDDNPVIRGMIKKVIHLIKVEEIKEEEKKKTIKKSEAKKETKPKEMKPKKVAPKKEKIKENKVSEPEKNTDKE